jgi:DNA mismatch repair protein MutL
VPERRPIQRLPLLLVNQIAAGEVVERPASVVKELVDNALDAGASAITVELEGGGIELIRVTDDGHGIPEAELPLAIAPHATSKVREASDLERIATMGFRGEALASIASVSRLTIRSRTANQTGASAIDIEGDRVSPVQPASGPVGTSITARNLFFNTPARRKFLRALGTEQGRCADIVRELAMSHPAVAFKLITDGRVALDLPAMQAPFDRVSAVLGKELAGQLLEVSSDDPGLPPSAMTSVAGASGGAPEGAATSRGRSTGHADDPSLGRPIALWGLIGRPAIARATGAAQHVFLNGRPIRDKTILHAIKEAFRGLIEPSRYPTAVLMLEVDPASVDVNVHPAKTEVRFRESSRIHSLIYRALRDTLRAADLTPTIDSPAPGSAAMTYGPRGILPAAGSSTGAWPRSGGGGGGSGASGGFADHFARPAPAATSRIGFDSLRNAIVGADAQDAVGTAAPQPEAPLPTPVIAPRLLQVHNAFLVTQDEQGVVIIDQHALHERVMFQRLLDRLGSADNTRLESQQLLVPERLPASTARLEALAALAPMLARLGIAAEPAPAQGSAVPSEILIRAFATFLFDRGVEPGPFLAEALDRAASENWSLIGTGPTGEEAVLHEVLDMMACKAAIKAGDKLSEGELADLLAMRESIERASNCPHGRPTSIRLTIKELERRFGRS